MKRGRKNICPRCKSEIPEGMAFCQFCMEIIESNGGVVEIESKYKPKVNKWFMAVVITALLILFIMFAVIIFMLSNPDKEETAEQSFSEISSAEQVTTVQATALNTMTTASTSTSPDTTTVTKINTTSTKTTTIIPDTAEILTDTAVPETNVIPDTEEIFTDDTTEPAVTEPVTEEMPTIQVPQADFETMIRNGFDLWTGLGDTETLSFSGYSCTFSDTLMGEYINCTLTVADDLRSYLLIMSGTEYSTGSFANGIDEPVRAFAEIVLGYKSPYMGGNIRGSIREMLNSNETSGHITDGDFNCDVEYDAGTQTVTINAYMN